MEPDFVFQSDLLGRPQMRARAGLFDSPGCCGWLRRYLGTSIADTVARNIFRYTLLYWSGMDTDLHFLIRHRILFLDFSGIEMTE